MTTPPLPMRSEKMDGVLSIREREKISWGTKIFRTPALKEAVREIAAVKICHYITYRKYYLSVRKSNHLLVK